MIRLKNLDSDTIIAIMSCLFHAETSPDTYTYYSFLKTILDTDEVSDEVYLIYSALDILLELYAIRQDVPVINKDVIISIIQQNLYYDIKENKDSLFQIYAMQHLGIELDTLDETTISSIGSHLMGRCVEFIDALLLRNLTIEESRGYISNLIDDYIENLCQELSQIIIHLTNNDTKIIQFQFNGWKRFLRTNKIYNAEGLTLLLRLTATIIDEKKQIAAKASDPLTSIGRLIELKEQLVVYDNPLGSWKNHLLDEYVSICPGTYTLCVGDRGLGKTTWGAFLTGQLMAQGLRVMFYCPELFEHDLLFKHILPAYIYAKYGFPVSMEQILGSAPLYEHHELLTTEQRADLIKAAELTLAEEGLFFHVDTYFHSKTILDDLRSKIIQFKPDVLVFDHTTDLIGDENLNTVTSNLAEAFRTIKKEFFVHIFALSHVGSDFKIPSRDRPIITDKICAWSRRLEGAADTVIGMFRNDDKMNIFYTKTRWVVQPPMWHTFRMDREHNWFYFLPQDQLGAQTADVLAQEWADDIVKTPFDSISDDDDDEDDGYDFA